MTVEELYKKLFEMDFSKSADLLHLIEKSNSEGLKHWLEMKDGATIYLRDILAKPFEKSSLYRKCDVMAFDSDWMALDAAFATA